MPVECDTAKMEHICIGIAEHGQEVDADCMDILTAFAVWILAATKNDLRNAMLLMTDLQMRLLELAKSDVKIGD